MQLNIPRIPKIEATNVSVATFANPNNRKRKRDPIKTTFKSPFNNASVSHVTYDDIRKLKEGLGEGTCLSYLLEVKENVPRVQLSNGLTARENSFLHLLDQGNHNALEDFQEANHPSIELPVLDAECASGSSADSSNCTN